MTFFRDMFEDYKRLTPSVQAKRSNLLLETIGKGGLVSNMNQTRLPFAPSQETVPEGENAY